MNRLKSIFAALCRIVIAGIFWVVARLLYDIEFHGLEHDPGRQHTYFAMAHKRDLDPIVEIPTILAHRGWRALAGNVHFAMRGDAFSPGFLARLVMQPRWFSHFLRLISVGPVLRLLGLHPFENLHFRPAEMWIRELLLIEGNVRAADVLTPTFLQKVATVAGLDYQQLEKCQLSDLLSWRYQQALQPFCSTEIFIEPARRHAKSYVLAKFKQELAELVAWLWNGGSLWGAPEGLLSPQGNLGPVTAALRRLLQAGPPDMCVLPIFIAYDFMTVRRTRIFVDLAPPN